MSGTIPTAPPSGQKRAAVLQAGLLLACALYALVLLVNYRASGSNLAPDFFGLWSFGQYLHGHAASGLYQPALLKAFQAELLPGFADSYPFPYPPSAMLLFWPLGWLPYGIARLAWIVLGLGLYLAATWQPRRAWITAGFALLAPSTAISVLYGQSGFFAAAAMIGGARLLKARPALAGVLFALLTYKPQLAMLPPLLLLMRREWRALAAFFAAEAALLLVTSLAFGPMIWPQWLAGLHGNVALVTGPRGLDTLMPTVWSNMLALGLPRALAWAAQALGLAAALLALWRLRHRPVLVLPFATFLATPYAFVYDLPMVTAGILFLAGALKKPARPARLAAPVLGGALPVLIYQSALSILPWSTLCMLLLLRSAANTDDDHAQA